MLHAPAAGEITIRQPHLHFDAFQIADSKDGLGNRAARFRSVAEIRNIHAKLSQVRLGPGLTLLLSDLRDCIEDLSPQRVSLEDFFVPGLIQQVA